MQRNVTHEIRHVGPQSEHLPHTAVREDRERRPVLIERSEKISQVPTRTIGKKLPVVVKEPLAASEIRNHDQRENIDRAKHDKRNCRVDARSRRWLRRLSDDGLTLLK